MVLASALPEMPDQCIAGPAVCFRGIQQQSPCCLLATTDSQCSEMMGGDQARACATAVSVIAAGAYPLASCDPHCLCQNKSEQIELTFIRSHYVQY
jgi:hypothetical protein